MTGLSALPGSATFHPFLWTRDKGIQDLGVLKGDLVGAGLAMNSRGDIVGASISAPGPAGGNPRAFLWQNGAMSDLNALVPADSPFYMMTACAINDIGEIAGLESRIPVTSTHFSPIQHINQRSPVRTSAASRGPHIQGYDGS